jgi:hypothetical protein
VADPPRMDSPLLKRSVANYHLVDMPGNSVKVHAEGTSGQPQDLILGEGQVLINRGGVLVAATLTPEDMGGAELIEGGVALVVTDTEEEALLAEILEKLESIWSLMELG